MDLRCEERSSDSPWVETLWRSRSERGERFVSMAESQYSLVVTSYRQRRFITLRGPSTSAAPVYSPEGAEFFGIQFKPGVFLEDMPASLVRERNDLGLPEAAGDAFWLKGSAWQYPNFENADTFVQRLVRGGLLLRDPLVAAALQRQSIESSSRTVRRRFLHAAGLPRGTLYQIERARQAVALLQSGTSILDVVHEAGYFDQPHLTRSLKRYIGFTPAQIVNPQMREPLSFLYKTSSILRNYDGEV